MASIRDHQIANLLDHAYAPSPCLSSWLDTLTADLATFAPSSLGAVGRIVRNAERAAPQLVCPYATAVGSGKVDRTLLTHARQSRHRIDVMEGSRGLRDMARRCDELASDPYVAEMASRFQSVGVRNLHHLTARDDSGHVMSLGILSSQRTRTALPRIMWRTIAAHLESAFRVQIRAHEELGSGAASDLLGAVAKLGQAPPAASHVTRKVAREVWDGVIAGTWSVIARRDHAGRRYVIAVPRARGEQDARGLTRREAQVTALMVEGYTDKEIAFMLGVARSTIAGYLREALWKLGLRSRLELTRAFRADEEAC